MVNDDDDPRAPYKVYEGEELKGTYATRAEARRSQQQLANPNRNVTSSLGTFWTALLYDLAFAGRGDAPQGSKPVKRPKWLGESRATKADKQKKAAAADRSADETSGRPGKDGPVARRSHGQGQEKKRLAIRSRAVIGRVPIASGALGMSWRGGAVAPPGGGPSPARPVNSPCPSTGSCHSVRP